MNKVMFKRLMSPQRDKFIIGKQNISYSVDVSNCFHSSSDETFNPAFKLKDVFERSNIARRSISIHDLPPLKDVAMIISKKIHARQMELYVSSCILAQKDLFIN